MCIYPVNKIVDECSSTLPGKLCEFGKTKIVLLGKCHLEN